MTDLPVTGQPHPRVQAANVALLLVDCINAFYSPGAAMWYPAVGETVEPILELIAAARRHQRLMVHTVERHRPGLEDFEWRKLPRHCQIGSDEGEIFAAFAPATATLEAEVVKRRYSAFFATDLALLLAENAVTTVIIAGVKTNVCVRATATDAFGHGFDVVVPREATNSNRPHLAEASLEDINRYVGTVTSTSAALELLAAGVEVG